MALFPKITETVKAGSEAISGNRLLSQGYLKYPQDNSSKHHVIIKFTILREETKSDGRTTTTPVKTCYMYLPEGGFTVADTATYDGASIGALGAIIANPNGSLVDNAVDAANTAIHDIANLLRTDFNNPSEQSKAVIAKLLQRTSISNSPIGNAIKTKLGVTANPHLRAIFNQVSLREFSYEFTMIPNSPKDSEEIKKIVRFFRANLYPDTISLESEELKDIAYKFPTKWEIEYYFRGKRIAHRLKPCYLKTVNTVFNNQGGQIMHYDGNFVSTKIALSFMEESTLKRDDIENLKDGIGY